jgi:hypothetical protein
MQDWALQAVMEIVIQDSFATLAVPTRGKTNVVVSTGTARKEVLPPHKSR